MENKDFYTTAKPSKISESYIVETLNEFDALLKRTKMMTQKERVKFVRECVREPVKLANFVNQHIDNKDKNPLLYGLLGDSLTGPKSFGNIRFKFEEYLTEASKKLHRWALMINNTIHQTLTPEGDTATYLVRWIQKEVKYRRGEEEEKTNEGVKWLANFFNKAVEKKVIGYGCFMLASEIDLGTEEQINDLSVVKQCDKDGYYRKLLFVWPVCLINGTNKQLNDIVGEGGWILQ